MFKKILEWYRGKEEDKTNNKKEKVVGKNSETTTHIFLDFDSIFPRNLDKVLINDSCHIWIFTGDANKFSTSIQEAIKTYKDHIHIITAQVIDNNPAPIYNAIFYYLGLIASRYSQPNVMIVSRRNALRSPQNEMLLSNSFASLVFYDNKDVLEKKDNKEKNQVDAKNDQQVEKPHSNNRKVAPVLEKSHSHTNHKSIHTEEAVVKKEAIKEDLPEKKLDSLLSKESFTQGHLTITNIEATHLFAHFVYEAMKYIIKTNHKSLPQNKSDLHSTIIDKVMIPILKEKNDSLSDQAIDHQADKIINELKINRLIEIHTKNQSVTYYKDDSDLFQRAKYFIANQQPKNLQQYIDMIAFYYLHEKLDDERMINLAVKIIEDLSITVEDQALIYKTHEPKQKNNKEFTQECEFPDALEKIITLIKAGHALPSRKQTFQNLIKTYKELNSPEHIDRFIQFLIDKKIISIHNNDKVQYLLQSNDNIYSTLLDYITQYIQRGHALPSNKNSLTKILQSRSKVADKKIIDAVIDQLLKNKMIVVTEDESIEYI